MKTQIAGSRTSTSLVMNASGIHKQTDLQDTGRESQNQAYSHSYYYKMQQRLHPLQANRHTNLHNAPHAMAPHFELMNLVQWMSYYHPDATGGSYVVNLHPRIWIHHRDGAHSSPVHRRVLRTSFWKNIYWLLVCLDGELRIDGSSYSLSAVCCGLIYAVHMCNVQPRA